MTLRTYRTFQALLLGLVGLFLLNKVWTGSVLFYLNQRFVVLVILAGIGCVILSQVVLANRPAAGETAGEISRLNLWVMLIPIAFGFLLPDRPLSSASLANRGINTSAPLTIQREDTAAVLALPSSQKNILDWMRTFDAAPDPRSLLGQPADLTGFVYHDGRLSGGQFMIGRFAITCCVADAFAVGIVVDWKDAGQLLENQWVRVRGVIDFVEMEGKPVPLLRASQVETIPEPQQPYLFP